jgi:hypothetical protein
MQIKPNLCYLVLTNLNPLVSVCRGDVQGSRRGRDGHQDQGGDQILSSPEELPQVAGGRYSGGQIRWAVDAQDLQASPEASGEQGLQTSEPERGQKRGERDAQGQILGIVFPDDPRVPAKGANLQWRGGGRSGIVWVPDASGG